MKKLTAKLSAAALCLTIACPGIYAADTPDKSDTSAADTTAKASKKRPFLSRLSVGGYGEVAYSRNFYSDNVNRYSHAADYRNAPSHGRFDIPHVVIMLGYDFGRGWTLGSEIEFEHGGTESAVEIENEEVGEYEKEIERGGEVALEQFWIQKSFCPQFNICAGHSDRLHDCRARNTLEAIMWHGSATSDARTSVENFRKLSKDERAAVIRFIDSI